MVQIVTGFLTAKQLSEKFSLANLSNLPQRIGRWQAVAIWWRGGGRQLRWQYGRLVCDRKMPTEFTPTAHTHDDRYYTQKRDRRGLCKAERRGEYVQRQQAVTGNVTVSGNVVVGSNGWKIADNGASSIALRTAVTSP